MPGSRQGRAGGRETYVWTDGAVISASVVFVTVLRLALTAVIRSNLKDTNSRVFVVYINPREDACPPVLVGINRPQ